MKQFNFKRGYYTTCFVEEKIAVKAKDVNEAIEKIDGKLDIPYLAFDEDVFVAKYDISRIDVNNVTPDSVEYLIESK